MFDPSTVPLCCLLVDVSFYPWSGPRLSPLALLLFVCLLGVCSSCCMLPWPFHLCKHGYVLCENGHVYGTCRCRAKHPVKMPCK